MSISSTGGEGCEADGRNQEGVRRETASGGEEVKARARGRRREDDEDEDGRGSMVRDRDRRVLMVSG